MKKGSARAKSASPSYTTSTRGVAPAHFVVEGGRTLKGSITINSSKNGAVVLLCASLLNRGVTVLKKMPRIEEVHRLIEVLQSIGVRVVWSGTTLTITPPKKLSLERLDIDAAKKTRSILMFLGPLVHLFREFEIPQSGGCKLGSRTVRPHFFALERFGVSIDTTANAWVVKNKRLKPADIVMYESGDTATENALMAAALIPGKTVIKYASANYMVQDLCHFLEACGIRIEGIGTTTLTVHGITRINKKITYALSEDPTDAMFFLAAAAVTRSTLTLKRCPTDFLELELLVLEKMNLKFSILRRYRGDNGKVALADIKVFPSNLVAPPEKVTARPYPGLNIDNLPFFAVIATQAEGETLIHDWVYEKRAIYYTELEKLGAEVALADPHRVFVRGKTPLRAAELVCPPALRPATILLIGMLGASGRSVLRNVYSISRGYEDLVEKLRSLGASISHTEE